MWTHGTIIDKGDYNHHNRSYKILVINTGRIITHKRQYIKPTPITTEDYIHYQANKHAKTDPLDAILDHIKKNPPTPTDKAIANERGDNKNMQGEHKDRTNLQGIREKQKDEVCSNTRVDNEYKNEGENIVNTGYGRILKKSDRLTYQQ